MTRRQPDRVPIKPKAITHNPHQGHHHAVISVCVDPFPSTPSDQLQGWLRQRVADALAYRAKGFHDLSVGVRVVGAQGETSRDEGRVG